MGTTITFRRGENDPTSGSGLTLAEPAFNTTLKTFHIGLGHGITAAWVGAPISGLSADIAAGITYKIPSAAAVKNYIGGLCFGNTGGGGGGAVSSVSGSGNGISVSPTTGAVVVSNTGVHSFNGLTGAIQGVSSWNGQTGAVSFVNYVVSFNGLTGAVGGVTTSAANTFVPMQSFSGGISAAGGTFSKLAVFISGIESAGITASTVTSDGTSTIPGYPGYASTTTVSADTINFVFDGVGGQILRPTNDNIDGSTRTNYLPASSGTLALTSQLMGAVNGSLAATTAVTSFNGRTGAVQGVSSAAAGTGISVSAATGAITITNTGVQSFNGSTGAVQGVSSVNGSTGAVITYAGTTGQIQFRYGSGITANQNISLESLGSGSMYDHFLFYGVTYSGGGNAVFYGNVEAKGLRIDRVYGELGLDEGGAVAIQALGIFNDGYGNSYGSDLYLTTPSTTNTNTSRIFIAPQGNSSLEISDTVVYSPVPLSVGATFTAQAGATFGGTITGATATFSRLTTHTAGLCAAGITVSGNIRFSGTSAKTISSNQATLTIAGASASSVLVGSNAVVMGVQVTDSLTLNSATSIVDISTTTSGQYPTIPSIRILTDDADTIGAGSIKIIPASYATANRTQYLQDASGTLALTSQLMGAVNGSTAATTAVTSFNGSTGAVQGVSSFNGLTGAVGGVCAAQANTFTALQTFNSGISASGGTFGSDISLSGINAVRIGVGPGNIGSNVCFGGGAFAVNTTGATNVAVGASSLAANTTGSSNVAVGRRSLFVATNGSGNVGIGSTALSALVNGSNNIGVGRQAADSITAATGGIYIGYLAAGTNSATNEIVVGTQASGFGSNTAVIGATTQSEAYLYGLVHAVGGVSAPGGTFSSLTRFTAGISAAGGVTFSGTIASDTGYRITSNAINAQTGTTYTFLDSDNGKVVTFNNGSAVTVTIPTGLPVGFNCTAIQLGAGQVGFTAASGVTMNAYASAYKISGQHGAAALISYTTNIFNLSGTLSA